MMGSGAGFAAMEERISPGSFFQFPLSGFRVSPNRSPSLPTDRERQIISLQVIMETSVRKSEEENLKGKPGHEHLSEPLHVLIEAELTEDIINSQLAHAVHFLESLLTPMDESMDHLQEGTAEGISSSEWYTKGKKSTSELEPLSEPKHASDRGTTGMVVCRQMQRFSLHPPIYL